MRLSKAVFDRTVVSSDWVLTTPAPSSRSSFLLDSLFQTLERENQMKLAGKSVRAADDRPPVVLSRLGTSAWLPLHGPT